MSIRGEKKHRRIKGNQGEDFSALIADEVGTVRKKWHGRLPVALLYPNLYPLAVSNLGFQLVYEQINRDDLIVCERFVYPQPGQPLRSLESNRPLTDFAVVCISVSFEQDYPHIAAMLKGGGLAPSFAEREDSVSPGSPLIVIGGAAVFMNPEPLAPFADCMIIGESEPVMPAMFKRFVDFFSKDIKRKKRRDILYDLAREVDGCYVPSFYKPGYCGDGFLSGVEPVPGVPVRVKKKVAMQPEVAFHSTLLSPKAALNMYMVELGRGCSRGCRFCAAGYIYRPPRMWSVDSIIKAIDKRPAGVDRVGLLGMEMADDGAIDIIADKLAKEGCSLSFSSLRADRISSSLLKLLASSSLKSVAIAPDGASERLRRLINKNLSAEDLLTAAARLSAAGILHIKLYVMIGLPTETEDDLEELGHLLEQMRAAILPIARKRKQMPDIVLSVNSFVPKPWTPFQYVSFGGLEREESLQEQNSRRAVNHLKNKIRLLRKMVKSIPNVRLKVDRPEKALEQAVFSLGDRRLARVIELMGCGGLSFAQAMKKEGLKSWDFVIRPKDSFEFMPWDIIDHGMNRGYLAKELERGLSGSLSEPCNTRLCRKCGVCSGEIA